MPTDQPYVMQRGDTLEAVVAKIYGDAAQLRAIIDYNNSPSVAQRRGGRLGQRVLPGDVIYLPTKRPTLSDVASSTSATSSTAPDARRKQAPGGQARSTRPHRSRARPAVDPEQDEASKMSKRAFRCRSLYVIRRPT